jgi:hypothetical protein
MLEPYDEHLFFGLYDSTAFTTPRHAESPTIQALHQFVAALGFRMTGRHRQIHLSHPAGLHLRSSRRSFGSQSHA